MMIVSMVWVRLSLGEAKCAPYIDLFAVYLALELVAAVWLAKPPQYLYFTFVHTIARGFTIHCCDFLFLL